MRFVQVPSKPRTRSANSSTLALTLLTFRGSISFYWCIPQYSSSRPRHKTVLLTWMDTDGQATELTLCALGTSSPFLVQGNKPFSSTWFSSRIPSPAPQGMSKLPRLHPCCQHVASRSVSTTFPLIIHKRGGQKEKKPTHLQRTANSEVAGGLVLH